MDSFTHITLGACLGDALLGKTIGKKAMFLGAFVHSLPDIDFLSVLWLNPSSYLLAHRGFTHSFLFILLLTPILTFCAHKFYKLNSIRPINWNLFFGTLLFIHLIIDSFNNYGTGWFEPFSHKRISFNTVYVADPFFSIWPFITCIALFILNWRSRSRKIWLFFGIGMSFLYIFYCFNNKRLNDQAVKIELKKQKIFYTKYLSTPAPLQNWLWYIVAGNDSGYYIGFHSLFDQKNKIDFNYYPINDSLLKSIRSDETIHQLKRFSQQYYTIEKWGDTLVFNDLRFGQIFGWQNIKAKFVFNFYLSHADENTLVVQRGRFSGWSKENVLSFVKRVKGN